MGAVALFNEVATIYSVPLGVDSRSEPVTNSSVAGTSCICWAARYPSANIATTVLFAGRGLILWLWRRHFL